MDLKEYAKYGLRRSRWFTSSILKSLEGDDWFFQPNPECHHALWIVGHLGLADNHFASTFRPDADRKPNGWANLFWFGSELKDDRSCYPSIDDVRSFFDERREFLIDLIDDLTAEEISAAAPPPDAMNPIAGAPNMGQLLIFASTHENLHAGQLTTIHRMLGNPPLFSPT